MTAETTHELIARRARHFGQGDKHGNWLFAADVACCVERGMGHGQHRSHDDVDSAIIAKVSAREFAEKARCHRKTVANHLKAWEAAARDGLVTPAAELTPDSEPDLPDADRWHGYFESVPPPAVGQAASAARTAWTAAVMVSWVRSQATQALNGEPKCSTCRAEPSTARHS